MDKQSEVSIWNSITEKELHQRRQKLILKILKNSESWKVQNYLKIIKNEVQNLKPKEYLKWKTSSSILKFRTSSCCLNRYSYVFKKPQERDTFKKKKQLQCCPHCTGTIEDIDHFIWHCKVYKRIRSKWRTKMRTLIDNDTFNKIIRKRSTKKLLTLINDNEIYLCFRKFYLKAMFLRSRENQK